MDYRFWRREDPPYLFVALVRNPRQAVHFRLRQVDRDRWTGEVLGPGPVPDLTGGWEPGLPKHLVPHVCAVRWTYDQVATINGWDRNDLLLAQLEAKANRWGPEMFLPLDLYQILQEPYVDMVPWRPTRRT